MKKNCLPFILFLSFIITGSLAQDPQYSQYYSSPLLLNPALAGSGDCYRTGLNARTQWTSLPGGAFNTGSFFIDMNYPDLRSGFGLSFMRDVIGTPRMSSNEISGFYSFALPFHPMFNVRMGLQGTYVARSLDYSRLIFEDQFDGIYLTDPVTSDPIRNYDKTRYADFSTGIVFFGEDSYWLGLSAHHINQPDQAFYRSESRLPVKYSIHGGWNFVTNKKSPDKATRIVPTFMYKSQTKFDQFDLGIYAIKGHLLLGAWYRGIPVKYDEKIRNMDAVIGQIGTHIGDFSFTYSYDFTISRLDIKNTHGSHEISLLYEFCANWPRRKKPSRHVRRLPCPDFHKSIKYDQNYLGF
jgi:type IX secretion system PorP/SprF family membrane protein